MGRSGVYFALCMACISAGCAAPKASESQPQLSIAWKDDILTVTGPGLPGDRIDIWYIEAYCRPGSTNRAWNKTVIGHKTQLIAADDHDRHLKLRCTLNDGVIVDHHITAGRGQVVFDVTAFNPTTEHSLVHWAQPCIRVDRFTGLDQDRYIEKCFIFQDNQLAMMPTSNWATDARYTPGQVWAAPGVSRDDINPRPLNPHTPSNGLIGCFSDDGQWVLATVWTPWQELFQGVIACIHNDFRIGGLAPGQTKRITGRLYIMPGDVEAMLDRYERDFSDD